MIGIEFSFPARRYHATPWDHHVNEGATEWPPAPWRILRALIATWYLKAQGDVTEESLRSVVHKLAGSLPRYTLPSGTVGHTRHYMPLYRDKTTKVFDTFVHVDGDAPLVAAWEQVELEPAEKDALRVLVERIGYLGRAESWVEARVVSDPEALPAPNASATEADGVGAGRIVRVLAPVSPSEYDGWQGDAVARQLDRILDDKRVKAKAKGKDPDTVKPSKGDREKARAIVPVDLFEALGADTASLHRQGWSRAPGTRWVDYSVPEQILESPQRRVARPAARTLPTVARFALSSAVLPHVSDVVSVAERVRMALNSHSDAAAVFSGKSPDGQPLAGHRHAFLIPEAADPRHARITHVTLYAPMGFDDRARHALESVRKVWSRHRGHDLQVLLVGLGQPSDLAGTNLGAGESPVLAESRVWISRTPFVPTRHPKTSGGEPRLDANGIQVGSPEHELRRLLELRGLPAPTSVESTPEAVVAGERIRWLKFHTARTGGGRRAARTGAGFRIIFAEPVQGPLALGFGAHFGLGVFVPDPSG